MKKLLAALIFFTRLPFYRLVKLPSDCFSHVVPYWPLTGWLTGGIMAATLWLAAQVFPLQIAWCMSIAVRLFVTGCLHEDGLADFFDGFGGGTTRERTLAIMKDSHIGTYGVVALVIYFLLLSQMYLMPLDVLCAVVFCADTYNKSCVAQIINLLPYSRKEEDSKTGKLYARMTAPEIVISVAVGFLPVCVLLPVGLWWACLAPIVVFAFLCMLMKKRIGGYTGDCCGAAFLLCELSFYLAAFALVLKLY